MFGPRKIDRDANRFIADSFSSKLGSGGRKPVHFSRADIEPPAEVGHCVYRHQHSESGARSPPRQPTPGPAFLGRRAFAHGVCAALPSRTGPYFISRVVVSSEVVASTTAL